MSGTVAETVHFQAEVKQLLKLMIHSLYSNKEIFLRELISNSSDALDKVRFLALENPSLLADDSDLEIFVNFDAEKNTVSIIDNGIGMTKEEVINNLGTIAKSGTKDFFDSLTGDTAKDSKLIGQFGVGFYSSFIVAKEVEVLTRKAGMPADCGVRWSSTGEGEYTLEEIEKAKRGTEIILHLKPEESEFANDYRLRHIITTYSDHISFPVVMPQAAKPEDAAEGGQDVKDVNPEMVTEVVNKATAIWTTPKNEISELQYQEFYKSIAHDFENPLAWAHNKVEGKLEYTSLLYIPARAPFDLWQPSKSRGLKLYVQRVFILDEVEQFLPNYLRFVKGVIDSNDLPLNVSREILQGNRVIDTMRNTMVKRVLSMLSGMAKNKADDYKQFWKQFGQVLKEGPAEDFTNKDEIAKLLRFATTYNDTEEQVVSLDDYIARMKEEQDKIYYVAGDSFNAVKNSPHLEIFRQRGIEVLLLSDRVDEWLMSHLTEFSGKKLQSIAKGEINLPNDANDKEQETIKNEFSACIEKMKTALNNRVKDIRITNRLTQSPACIVADENDMSAQMERIMRAAGQHVPETKPILELNPQHNLVKRLSAKLEDADFADWAALILDQAILAEGGQLAEPAEFVKRLNTLLLPLA